MTDHASEIELEAPGAGIPAMEQWLLGVLGVRLLGQVTSWERAGRRFRAESDRILALAGTLDPERLVEPVLVDRLVGIEDSSRRWSAAMTLEHLVIVGRGIAEIARGLAARDAAGEGPAAPVIDVADFKPTGALGPKAPEAFRAFTGEYLAAMNDPTLDRGSRRRHRHPWFGPLTAHQWHTLAGAHQGLHRRQIERIIATIMASSP